DRPYAQRRNVADLYRQRVRLSGGTPSHKFQSRSTQSLRGRIDRNQIAQSQEGAGRNSRGRAPLSLVQLGDHGEIRSLSQDQRANNGISRSAETGRGKDGALYRALLVVTRRTRTDLL